MSEMSSQQILARVRQMVPPMLSKFHKGQLGRICVIGGSEDYTGAPYFSAMASARLGCDMSHVICTPAAAAVIKTYSPNLMVHPLMRQAKGGEDIAAAADEVSRRVIEMLPRLHVLVIGPGLGRDPLMQATVAHVVAAARKANLPLVLDADALQIVQKQPELVSGYGLAVLTPNVVEFKRLEDALVQDVIDHSHDQRTARALRLSRALGGVTIVQKGAEDVIASAASDGASVFVSDHEGGLKRSGGQGDTLTGAIATFLGWRKAYLDGLWEVEEKEGKLGEQELVLLAAYGGSAITRECSRLAFAKRGRSLQASDLTEEVHVAFTNLIGDDSSKL
ncbi:hypothetical protein F503_02488 [Ophiostoma piceae UAMH 11346]|uniref:ATP-dependent (S)-NAD(P)H-hydrate dehydratase n=1 Tax=Ophiostoma piceae (strain UAMH 11346) TaxID=1262450 RepID=S3CZH5_OPHP1|nr:hypothetical protein F503_02488 [Ophiostoma piceae UAMH 11346]